MKTRAKGHGGRLCRMHAPTSPAAAQLRPHLRCSSRRRAPPKPAAQASVQPPCQQVLRGVDGQPLAPRQFAAHQAHGTPRQAEFDGDPGRRASSLALPSTGGAARRTRNAPSCRPSACVRRALGDTLTASHSTSPCADQAGPGAGRRLAFRPRHRLRRSRAAATRGGLLRRRLAAPASPAPWPRAARTRSRPCPPSCPRPGRP